ncbi:MAG: hypothetical protein IJR85_08435 [Synergistaceae bacterium]|nr:hypothetical protein [Synergistaceae bacterium]
MRKIFCAVVLLVVMSSTAFSASKAEMKKMSVFLSNFTEAGLFNFDMKADFDDDEDEQEGETPIHLGMPANVAELVRFGIVHNLINNYKSRIRKCTDPECESGSLTIDAKFVNESVKKYFGVDLAKKDLRYIDPEENPSVAFTFDGKLYHFDADSFSEPGNDTVYYADVQGVIQEGRNLSLAGDIYNSKKTTDRPGMFAATVKPSGKSWVIIDMTTDWVTNGGRD